MIICVLTMPYPWSPVGYLDLWEMLFWPMSTVGTEQIVENYNSWIFVYVWIIDFVWFGVFFFHQLLYSSVESFLALAATWHTEFFLKQLSIMC